jgi:hydroxypyruvate reductase
VVCNLDAGQDLSASDFSTQTLAIHPYGEQITQILSSAVAAVEPGAAIRRFLKCSQDRLFADDQLYDLCGIKRVFIAAIGKAAVPMSAAAADIIGEKLTGGLVICKHLPEVKDSRFTTLKGGHPVPNEDSLNAGKALMAFVNDLAEDDLLICLISGGGSALVTLPYEGVGLADMQHLTEVLLACGARIDEINTLRRHFDRIKGAGLAKAASPAFVISLILSDVVNSPLEAIASGPTAPDPSTIAEVLEIIRRYNLADQLPRSIINCLQMGYETPKPGDPLFDRVQNVLVASNELASAAAMECAAHSGFETVSLGNAWQGEARQVARLLIEKMKKQFLTEKPLCLVAGGETTVTLRGRGKGGRNQELALASVPLLARETDCMLITMATDGEDGPTDAAGAVVTQQTFQKAKSFGLDPESYLENNDAYNFFAPLGDLLKPGPTGTNVNDLTFLFRFLPTMEK